MSFFILFLRSCKSFRIAFIQEIVIFFFLMGSIRRPGLLPNVVALTSCLAFLVWKIFIFANTLLPSHCSNTSVTHEHGRGANNTIVTLHGWWRRNNATIHTLPIHEVGYTWFVATILRNWLTWAVELSQFWFVFNLIQYQIFYIIAMSLFSEIFCHYWCH